MITLKQILAVAAVSTSVLAPAAASAGNLPCVQRAIDFINSSTPTSSHTVTATAVSLHSTAVAAYLTSQLRVTICSGPNHTFPACLESYGFDNALLSNTGGQPFDVHQPLPMEFNWIGASTSVTTELISNSASYDFTGTCTPDNTMLVGNDQWGNHWTIAFLLTAGPPPPR